MSLRGNSKSEGKDTRLARLREERREREALRVKTARTVLVQSLVRRFLCRARLHKVWRSAFDADRAADRVDGAAHTLSLFFHPQIDADRLVSKKPPFSFRSIPHRYVSFSRSG